MPETNQKNDVSIPPAINRGRVQMAATVCVADSIGGTVSSLTSNELSDFFLLVCIDPK